MFTRSPPRIVPFEIVNVMELLPGGDEEPVTFAGAMNSRTGTVELSRKNPAGNSMLIICCGDNLPPCDATKEKYTCTCIPETRCPTTRIAVRVAEPPIGPEFNGRPSDGSDDVEQRTSPPLCAGPKVRPVSVIIKVTLAGTLCPIVTMVKKKPLGSEH